MKNRIISKINESDFIFHQNNVIPETSLGITTNKIVEIPNFLDKELVPNIIQFFEECNIKWGDIAFYGSSGKAISTDDSTMQQFNLPNNFFESLKLKFQESVEKVFERKVRPNTSHAQKWDVGGFANPHSDNSDHSGVPNAFEINKYVGILYLNDDYEGGELYFCDKSNNLKPYLSFKPNALSYYVFPGGVENIHGVTEITKGVRYTMVSFWDYAEIEYSEETKKKWKEEEALVRSQQARQKEEWAKGNIHA
jgi:hypothetical protein